MIGKLRHRITIEEKSRTPDGMGGFDESWSTFATVFAQVEPASGRERMFADKIEMNLSHKITIRYLEDLDSDMRISFKGRIFKILSFKNLEERGRFTEISCEEGSGS